MRVLPQHEEMWAWMKGIGAEVEALSPVLLSPDDLGPVDFTPADAPLHTKLKRHDERLDLIAVNAGKEACEATFDLGRKLPPQVEVMFEERATSTEGKKLVDRFDPLAVHVYDLGATST